MSINPPTNNGYVPPAAQTQLSVQGHSLDTGVLTCNEGQWSNVSEVLRTQYQAQTLNNFQMLSRGVWSNPTGIGFIHQRSAAFNSGAAFMDFGVFEDFTGNQTMLFQVGNTVYSYNLATSTETAYGAPLNSLRTSLANLPCMRSFLDNTGQAAPVTIYCNGDIQPQEITGTASNNVQPLGFLATGSPTTLNPNGGVFGVDYPISTYSVGTFITSYPSTDAATYVCLGPDGNVWFTAGTGAIGSIAPLGTVVNIYTSNVPAFTPTGICAGPDNRIWTCYTGVGKIAATTTTGTIGTTTQYNTNGGLTNGNAICTDGTNIYSTQSNQKAVYGYTVGGLTTPGITTTTVNTAGGGLCLGPDGRLWSTTAGASIQATTFGGTTVEYTSGFTSGCTTVNICAGPSGTDSLYFTDNGTNSIGIITVAGAVTEFLTPTKLSSPFGICLGSDGNIWFTENVGNNIGRLTISNNSITEFPGPPTGSNLKGICTGVDGNLWFAQPGASPVSIGTMLVQTIGLRGICVGPDSRLWFCEYATNTIGALTVQGVLTQYPLPNTASGPFDICAGPDGALWFTEQIGNRIGRITTAGVITEFTAGLSANSVPSGICSGPDGNLWFTEFNTSNVANINPTTHTITEHATLTSSAQPEGICSNGTNLYVCESAVNKVAQVTTAGVFTEHTVPTSNSKPLWIALGADGNLWFTENVGNKIGKMTPSGTFTEYIIPTSGSQPEQITAASNGDLYFVEAAGNNIGRITTAGAIVEYPIDINNAEPFGIVDGPDQSIWFTMNGVSELGNFLYGGSGTFPGVFQLTKKTYSAPRFCCYFNNRMAYFGFATGSNAALDVLISNQGLAGSFVNSTPILATDAVAFTIPGLGLPTGMAAFRLTNTNNQEVLILGFQRGVAVIDGADATTYAADILTYDYGLMSNRCFVQIQNDMHFMSTNGWRTFSNLTINANLLNASLTYQMQDVIASITTDKISGSNILANSQAFMVHHPSTLEVQCWFPEETVDIVGGSYENQHAIIGNYNSMNPVPQQINPLFSTKSGVGVACGINFQGTFYGGSYGGHLQQHYSGNTYNGSAIPGTIVLSLISGDNLQESLELRQGLVVVEDTGTAQNFNVETYFYEKMVTGGLVRMASPEALQVLTAPSTGFVNQVYFEATGSGQYIEFDLTTNGTSQALDFTGLAWTSTVGGLRP